MMPPPTITVLASSGSGPRGCSGWGPERAAGGCSGVSRWRTISSGRPARLANAVGESGGRARNGTCASAGSPARLAQKRTAAARQLFPWQGPVPSPVYRFMLSTSA